MVACPSLAHACHVQQADNVVMYLKQNVNAAAYQWLAISKGRSLALSSELLVLQRRTFRDHGPLAQIC
jgi:hypothetical protein